MENENIKKVLDLIVGEIKPTGQDEEDEIRIDNFKKLRSLNVSIIQDMLEVSRGADSLDPNISKAGNYAYCYLKALKKLLNDSIE